MTLLKVAVGLVLAVAFLFFILYAIMDIVDYIMGGKRK